MRDGSRTCGGLSIRHCDLSPVVSVPVRPRRWETPTISGFTRLRHRRPSVSDGGPPRAGAGVVSDTWALHPHAGKAGYFPSFAKRRARSIRSEIGGWLYKVYFTIAGGFGSARFISPRRCIADSNAEGFRVNSNA